jgi:Flp pilus assembly protein TadB
MENEKLTGSQSLGIIEQMINTARNDHRERGDGWLLWGWLLFVASVLSAVFMVTDLRTYISWVWFIMLGLGLLLNILMLARYRRRELVTTYVQELLHKLGIGFFVSLFILIGASYLSRMSFAFGYFYVLYAFWMFIHGSAIRFRPFIIGAVVNWLAAVAIFIVQDFYYAMLISAVAVLVGYLIPGHMLRRQYYQSMKRKDYSV